MLKNYTSATQTRMITLIEVKSKVGGRANTLSKEPFREVIEYFTTDGRLFAHIDPYENKINSMPCGSNYIVQDH